MKLIAYYYIFWGVRWGSVNCFASNIKQTQTNKKINDSRCHSSLQKAHGFWLCDNFRHNSVTKIYHGRISHLMPKTNQLAAHLRPHKLHWNKVFIFIHLKVCCQISTWPQSGSKATNLATIPWKSYWKLIVSWWSPGEQKPINQPSAAQKSKQDLARTHCYRKI